MRNFRFPTENIADANRLSDDTDRIRMHVNTPVEISGTQKNRIRRSDVVRSHLFSLTKMLKECKPLPSAPLDTLWFAIIIMILIN